MKKILVTVLSVISLSSFAQKAIDNGIIEMKVETGNAMMPEMKMTYFIKGDQAKMEMGGNDFFAMSMYQDNAKKKIIMTMDLMGMKKGFTATPEELEADIKKDTSAPKSEIKYLDEEKTILGYKSKKAIYTSYDPKTGEKHESTIWYTPDLKMPKMADGSASMGSGNPMGEINDKINGMMMEYSTKIADGELKMTVTKIDLAAVVKDETFVVSKDYELKTYNEFKEEMKGMMGGGN